MAKNKLVAPVVKWVGGKRQLLNEITPRLPKRITSYCEPFLGGGAVCFLFSLQKQLWIEKQICDELTRRGIQFMLSNSATSFIKELYRDYDISIVWAKRKSIQTLKNAGAIEEVLIRNYR